MCGIAGIIHESGSDGALKVAVRRMIALQQHRGPDGEGFYDTIGASLGHCRLAILDPSDAGRQPMSDHDGRYWVTFNGEIYNYLELAAELLPLGCQFRGGSDTEVLLAAYRQWGEGCLERLRGMFAFAIWDEKDHCLFAARDRFGIKPFHYWTDGNSKLAFASEIKPLIEFLPQRHVNLHLARQFLAWNLLDHQPEETMLAGIKRLPPAHFLTWRHGQGLALRRYWHFPEVNEALQTHPSEKATLIMEFRRRFYESISLHLRSDVPVGTCLSGGLDSSSIVCVASSELRSRGVWQEGWQHTFSACFEDPRLDERPYIRAVADATGCQTHFVFPSGERLCEEIDKWLWHQEEPVGASNTYAQYCVARLARENGIKVLLDGQGADEQLAGYRKFILVYIRQLVAKRQYSRALREAVAFFSSPEILRTTRPVDGRRYLFNSVPEVAQLWPDNRLPERPPAFSLGYSLGRRLEADLMLYSLPVLLRYEDRNTMAFGVEGRVPFVDHPFVEWIATLPADMHLSDGWTKRILREALVGVLPERVRTRKSKLGFSTPESQWLAGPLVGWLRNTLSMPRYLQEVVDIKAVQRLLDCYLRKKGPTSLENILFRLAIYELWARQFINLAVPGK